MLSLAGTMESSMSKAGLAYQAVTIRAQPVKFGLHPGQ
jgi:hypothetical protein